MNKILGHVLKLQMRILIKKTGGKYYILQLLVLLVYGHGAYINFFYRHQKIERYPFQFMSIDKQREYKHRTLNSEKRIISTKNK